MGKERREQGYLERKKRVVKKRKIPLEELKVFVDAHPDAFLREIGHILIVLSLQYGQF